MVLPPASKRQRPNAVSIDQVQYCKPAVYKVYLVGCCTLSRGLTSFILQVDSSVSVLVDSNDFDVLRKNMETFDAQREVVIKRSRGK